MCLTNLCMYSNEEVIKNVYDKIQWLLDKLELRGTEVTEFDAVGFLNTTNKQLVLNQVLKMSLDSPYTTHKTIKILMERGAVYDPDCFKTD